MRLHSRPERDAVLTVLFRFMRQRRVSIRQLVRDSGMTRPYLERRLSGSVSFTLEDLSTLAPILGVEVHHILDEVARLLRKTRPEAHPKE